MRIENKNIWKSTCGHTCGLVVGKKYLDGSFSDFWLFQTLNQVFHVLLCLILCRWGIIRTVSKLLIDVKVWMKVEAKLLGSLLIISKSISNNFSHCFQFQPFHPFCKLFWIVTQGKRVHLFLQHSKEGAFCGRFDSFFLGRLDCLQCFLYFGRIVPWEDIGD